MGDDIEPGTGPDPDGDKGDDPFKGTPMEGLFAAFGGMGGQSPTGAGYPQPDLSALFSQMQQMFQPHEGPINFAMAKDVARQAAATEPDPTKRLKLLADAEKILLDEAPIIPIYFYVNYYLLKDNIQGLYENPRNMQNFKAIDVVR